MTNRKIIFIAILAFAVTLAIVTGTRLAGQALSVAFGVAAGVAVGVPTSILVAGVSRQGLLNSQVEHFASPRADEANMTRTQSEFRHDRSEREFTVVGGAGPPLLDESLTNGHHN